jgi:hypothetical protein
VIAVFIGLVYMTVMFAMWVKLDPSNKYASQIGALRDKSSSRKNHVKIAIAPGFFTFWPLEYTTVVNFG